MNKINKMINDSYKFLGYGELANSIGRVVSNIKIQDERKRNKLIKKAHNQNYELILTLLSKEKLNSKLIREYDIR